MLALGGKFPELVGRARVVESFFRSTEYYSSLLTPISDGQADSRIWSAYLQEVGEGGRVVPIEGSELADCKEGSRLLCRILELTEEDQSLQITGLIHLKRARCYRECEATSLKKNTAASGSLLEKM